VDKVGNMLIMLLLMATASTAPTCTPPNNRLISSTLQDPNLGLLLLLLIPAHLNTNARSTHHRHQVIQ
jgi:hypothetical protein